MPEEKYKSLMTGHPDIAEVAVAGVPSAEWGESPYAVVVLRPGAQPSEANLIAWTRDRLAPLQMPRRRHLHRRLARGASGKLQKQAIRSSLATPAVPSPASTTNAPRAGMLTPVRAWPGAAVEGL